MKPQHIAVTGISRGLGKVLAIALAEDGHRVSGCARSASQLAELGDRLGSNALLAPVDVTESDSVEAWAERSIERFGPPDLVVNNAALINRNAPLWEISAHEMDQLLAVNLGGVVNVIRAFVPVMIERGSGMVVNMSSGWGRTTSPEVAPYCATKWGIEGLTQALAQELPQGLGAIALSPGVIDTDMLRSCMGAEAANYPDPERWVRNAVPYLLSLTPSQSGASLTVPTRPDFSANSSRVAADACAG